jgi:hypothetical protein
MQKKDKKKQTTENKNWLIKEMISKGQNTQNLHLEYQAKI